MKKIQILCTSLISFLISIVVVSILSYVGKDIIYIILPLNLAKDFLGLFSNAFINGIIKITLFIIIYYILFIFIYDKKEIK